MGKSLKITMVIVLFDSFDIGNLMTPKHKSGSHGTPVFFFPDFTASRGKSFGFLGSLPCWGPTPTLLLNAKKGSLY